MAALTSTRATAVAVATATSSGGASSSRAPGAFRFELPIRTEMAIHIRKDSIFSKNLLPTFNAEPTSTDRFSYKLGSEPLSEVSSTKVALIGGKRKSPTLEEAVEAIHDYKEAFLCPLLNTAIRKQAHRLGVDLHDTRHQHPVLAQEKSARRLGIDLLSTEKVRLAEQIIDGYQIKLERIKQERIKKEIREIDLLEKPAICKYRLEKIENELAHTQSELSEKLQKLIDYEALIRVVKNDREQIEVQIATTLAERDEVSRLIATRPSAHIIESYNMRVDILTSAYRNATAFIENLEIIKKLDAEVTYLQRRTAELSEMKENVLSEISMH